MPNLEASLGERVEQLRQLSVELMRSNERTRASSVLIEAWEILPEPKTQWSESYHIASYLSQNYLALRLFEEARTWSQKLFDCDNERIDSGEREFIAGKISFEEKDMESAAKFFTIANEKSNGRYFKPSPFSANSKEEKDKLAEYRKLIGFAKVPANYQELLKEAENEFTKNNYKMAVSLFNDCLNFEKGINEAKIYLRKGQCLFELNDLENCANSLIRAYMIKVQTFLQKKILNTWRS